MSMKLDSSNILSSHSLQVENDMRDESGLSLGQLVRIFHMLAFGLCGCQQATLSAEEGEIHDPFD